MSARVSIIIPTLNAADALPETLDSLLPGVAQGILREVIVSDGGSTDTTRQIADDAGAVIIEGAAGRGGQIARGTSMAKAPWVLVLHADSHLPPDWVGAVAVHMNEHSGQAAVFRLTFRAKGILPAITAGWANLRTRIFHLPYGDQGLLISRAVLDQIGGYPDQPLMEDVAVARALKGRLRLLDETITTSAERYQRRGWTRQGARNILTLARYLCGASPDRLARIYHKR
ncbi:TIGR04283 family arsenosugar biosynthesis glycosyltransferase [Litoreibacter roseus]|uniref:Glycosyl transferase n=1 Tax=Litoreibacter roseus TaxID=2601869 RepID=A0A6N6JB50_9RHOB|nr:TIGR04283 family arsenosugar biosynthesis glycosyltransferase [Litoreibacter roseus]GFE63461.1 glycosyl transferase [Litoreibacter roseus]